MRRFFVNDDAVVLEFSSREEYRTWLTKNCQQEQGIWITFVKGSKQFTANDALEESICFGWIDGVMKSIDEQYYKKYFSHRKDVQKWSEKNKAIYEKMVKSGLMTRAGTEVFKAGEKKAQPAVDINEKIQILRNVLKDNNEILALFDAKSPSRQKQFAGFYGEAKTDATKAKRKNKIMEALINNYSGMLY